MLTARLRGDLGFTRALHCRNLPRSVKS
ncbi:hypothetical protein PSCLAVI8L_120041 [Pseudoclavibacter sp. 8L]|nr:hypothetical protein PSCLAVI8L_120041 [Pseudoclavibacter sp. 8L]